MILSYRRLAHYQKKVVMIDGCFDPIHTGHIEYFRRAAEFGLPVLCSVENDTSILQSKGRPHLLDERTRLCVVDAIRYISFAHLNTTSTADILRRLKPVKYIKGSDWKGKLPEEEIMICRESGIAIVYLDTVVNSSTRILRHYVKRSVAPKLRPLLFK